MCSIKNEVSVGILPPFFKSLELCKVIALSFALVLLLYLRHFYIVWLYSPKGIIYLLSSFFVMALV